MFFFIYIKTNAFLTLKYVSNYECENRVLRLRLGSLTRSSRHTIYIDFIVYDEYGMNNNLHNIINAGTRNAINILLSSGKSLVRFSNGEFSRDEENSMPVLNRFILN